MLQYEVIPPVAGREPAAWVLVLHGLGDSMAGWKPAAGELGLEECGFVFVNAPQPYYDGWSWFRIPGLTAPDHRREHFLADLAASRAALAALVEHLTETEGITPGRLVLLGFSQGCCMVVDQALRSPHRFAAVVGISGFIGAADSYPESFGPQARSQALLVTHGRFDDLLPIDVTRAQVEALAAMGVDVTWHQYDKAHAVDLAREFPAITAFIREHLP